jgi:hypothetical protein
MDKQPTLLSPDGDAELKRLYADLAHASRRATAFLRTSGMTSPAFLRADREVTRNQGNPWPYRQALDGALTRTNSRSFATLAAIRLASSLVSNLAADRRPGLLDLRAICKCRPKPKLLSLFLLLTIVIPYLSHRT